MDYQVDTILAGKASEDIIQRAKNGKFDERLALLGMILDAITAELRTVCDKEKVQTELLGALKNVRIGLTAPKADAVALVEKQIKSKQDAISVGKKHPHSLPMTIRRYMALSLLWKKKLRYSKTGHLPIMMPHLNC